MRGEKIRILHVITRLILGGAQENTLLTVAHLDRARFDVTLASGPTYGTEGSLEDQIPHDIAFERIPELIRHPHPLKDLLAIRRLYALMRRGRFQIVHTHTTKAGILGRVAARLAQVPIVIHTPHGHAFHGYLNRAESQLLKWVERGLARWTDRIICLTERERQDHFRSHIGPSEQFAVIHSGVDLDRFKKVRIDTAAKRRALGLPATGALVGCVARLVPIKGVDYLLEALPLVRAEVPDATAVFVGDGPLRSELEQRATRLGQDGAVAFLGLRRDVEEIMPLFDVVVLPSLNEGMGKAAVEAMAAGRPVVAFRIGGLQEVIEHGRTGLVVRPGDSKALATAIVGLVRDPLRSTAMGAAGRARAEEFGIAGMMEKLTRLYETLWQQRFEDPLHRSSKISTPYSGTR